MIYLDHASTTPVLSEVRDEIISIMDRVTGNPSNLHRLGLEAARQLRLSRTKIAECLGVLPTEIFFCSCGTEANNWIFESVLATQPELQNIVVSSIEHASVHFKAESLRETEKNIIQLPVLGSGVIDLQKLPKILEAGNSFLSLIAVNNETGMRQPLADIRSCDPSQSLLFHTDATQALGKVPFLPAKLGVDFATFSGHKIGAPKGIGFLFKKQNLPFGKMLQGGSQEFGYRGGTENIPYIAGLAKAVEIATEQLSENQKNFSQLSKTLRRELSTIQGLRFHGTDFDNPEKHSQAIFNFSAGNIPSDILQIRLSDAGLCVSGGSACSSGANRPSRVLTAMGVPDAEIKSALRMSISPSTTQGEVTEAVATFKGVLSRLGSRSQESS